MGWSPVRAGASDSARSRPAALRGRRALGESLEQRQLLSASPSPLTPAPPESSYEQLGVQSVADGDKTIATIGNEIVRYNSDGTLDQTFGSGGIVSKLVASGQATPNSLAVESDGDILVGGGLNGIGYGAFLTELTPDGSVDSAASNSGYLLASTNIQLGDFQIAPDGKIVLAIGSSQAGTPATTLTVERLNADGSLDTTFGQDGMVTTPTPDYFNTFTMAVAADGSIDLVYPQKVLTGLSAGLSIVQYSSAGVQVSDTQVAVPGFGAPTNVEIQADGDLMITGSLQSAVENGSVPVGEAIVMLTPSLQFDASFGNGGVMQYLYGNPSFDLDASPNQSAAPGAAVSLPGFAAVASAGVSGPNGQLLDYDVDVDNPSLFSVLPSISLDGTLSYQLAPGASGAANVSVALEDAGQGLTSTTQTFTISAVAGASQPVTGSPLSGDSVVATLNGGAELLLTVYLSNGEIDSSFGQNGVATIEIASGEMENVVLAEIQPDGKILVAAVTHTPTNCYGSVAARINPDGTLDSTFGENGVSVYAPPQTIDEFDFTFTGGVDQYLLSSDQPQAETNSTWASVPTAISGLYGQSLYFTVAVSNPALFSSLPTVSADGALNYTISPNVSGISDVTVTLRASNHDISSLSQTFAITVAPIRQGVASYAGNGAIVADGLKTISVEGGNSIARFNSDGTLDASFGVNGVVSQIDASDNVVSIGSIAVEPNGDILVGGLAANVGGLSYGGFLALLTPNGGLTSATADDGFFDFPLALDGMTVAPDGQILVAVNSATSGIDVERLNADGSLDTTFGQDGVAAVAAGTYTNAMLTIAEDGSIYVATQQSAGTVGLLITELSAAGQFVTSSLVPIDGFRYATSMRMAADGDLLIQGDVGPADYGVSGAVLVQLTSDLVLDPTFGAGGVLEYTLGLPAFSLSPTANQTAPPSTAITVENFAAIDSAGEAGALGQSYLSYLVTTDNDALFSVLPSISLDGTLSYQLAPGASGVATVSVTFDDAGQALASPTETFTISAVAGAALPTPTPVVAVSGVGTVVPVNYVFSYSANWQGDSFQVNSQPQDYESAPGASIDVNPAASSGSLYFVVADDNPALFSVAPSVDASGVLTYTIAPNVSGAAQLTVTMRSSTNDIAYSKLFTVAVSDPWQNSVNPYDVLNSGGVATPLDVLTLIAALQNGGGLGAAPSGTGAVYLDVNGDGILSPLDVVDLIAYLQNQGATPAAQAAGAQAEAVQAETPQATATLQTTTAAALAASALKSSTPISFAVNDSLPLAALSAASSVGRNAMSTAAQTGVANPLSAIVVDSTAVNSPAKWAARALMEVPLSDKSPPAAETDSEKATDLAFSDIDALTATAWRS